MHFLKINCGSFTFLKKKKKQKTLPVRAGGDFKRSSCSLPPHLVSASCSAAVWFLRASLGSPAKTRPRPAQTHSHLRELSRVLTAPAQAPRSPGCRCLTARWQAASWLVAGTRACTRPGAAARGCCVFAFHPGSPGRYGKPCFVFLSSLYSSLPCPHSLSPFLLWIPCRLGSHIFIFIFFKVTMSIRRNVQWILTPMIRSAATSSPSWLLGYPWNRAVPLCYAATQNLEIVPGKQEQPFLASALKWTWLWVRWCPTEKGTEFKAQWK